MEVFSNMDTEFPKVALFNMADIRWRGRDIFGQFQFISAIRFEGGGGTVDTFIYARETMGEDHALDVRCLIYADTMWQLDKAYIQVLNLWNIFVSNGKVLVNHSKEIFEDFGS